MLYYKSGKWQEEEPMPIKTSTFGFSDYEIELKRKPKKTILDKINQLIDWHKIEQILSLSYQPGKSPRGEKPTLRWLCSKY